MKTKDLITKSKAELQNLLREKKAQLLKLKFESSQKKIKNVKAIKGVKKDIARILTLLNLNKD